MTSPEAYAGLPQQDKRDLQTGSGASFSTCGHSKTSAAGSFHRQNNPIRNDDLALQLLIRQRAADMLCLAKMSSVRMMRKRKLPAATT
jgi:hypothetical protein